MHLTLEQPVQHKGGEISHTYLCVLAGIAVNDFASALTWYQRLLGRPAEAAPMEGFAEWHFSVYGGLQLIHDEYAQDRHTSPWC